MRPWLAPGLLVAGLVVAGCALDPSAPPRLTVFAAASLGDAFSEIAAAHEEDAGIMIDLGVDSSAALRVQIESGAPADVFAAADTVEPGRLVDAGLAREVVPFASNRLALVVPAGNPAAIRVVTDIGRPGVRLVAAGAGVPISRYAAAVVERVADLPGAPPDFAAAVAANIVSREDNVRAVLAKVALGEADAAFVYETDARSSDAVSSIEIPPPATVVAEYAVVIVSTTPHPTEAAAFVDWLLGPGGRAILERHGFGPPIGP